MALAQAIRQAMQARGLTAGAVTRRLGERRDYTTFFHLLNGWTTDPRVTTLVRVCAVLETSPSELLDLAGVGPRGRQGGPQSMTCVCGRRSGGYARCPWRGSGGRSRSSRRSQERGQQQRT